MCVAQQSRYGEREPILFARKQRKTRVVRRRRLRFLLGSCVRRTKMLCATPRRAPYMCDKRRRYFGHQETRDRRTTSRNLGRVMTLLRDPRHRYCCIIKRYIYCYESQSRFVFYDRPWLSFYLFFFVFMYTRAGQIDSVAALFVKRTMVWKYLVFVKSETDNTRISPAFLAADVNYGSHRSRIESPTFSVIPRFEVEYFYYF